MTEEKDEREIPVTAFIIQKNYESLRLKAIQEKTTIKKLINEAIEMILKK